VKENLSNDIVNLSKSIHAKMDVFTPLIIVLQIVSGSLLSVMVFMLWFNLVVENKKMMAFTTTGICISIIIACVLTVIIFKNNGNQQLKRILEKHNFQLGQSVSEKDFMRGLFEQEDVIANKMIDVEVGNELIRINSYQDILRYSPLMNLYNKSNEIKGMIKVHKHVISML
jgi:hypothetical protein